MQSPHSLPRTGDGAGPAPTAVPSRPPHAEHVVQFYESEQFLADRVADFLAEGLQAGESALVLATAAHRDAFSNRLRLRGLDLDRMALEARYVVLDAYEVLAAVMAGDAPDEQRFRTIVTDVIRTCRGDAQRPMLAYGELVDVLLRRGNATAAIRLEEWWNEITRDHQFSLFCAYAMGHFSEAAHEGHLKSICGQHAHVFPTERYRDAGDAGGPAQIVVLQQRARALETELRRRARQERRLRRALAAKRAAREALSEFLEHAAEGIHCVGADGRILWANRAELDMLGYARDEYVGHHIAEFHADQAVIADMLDRLARDERLDGCEATLRCKDGTLRTVLVSSNVRWRDGEFAHTRCFTRDVTALKAAQLEREVLLARERAARAEAEEASRAKSEFLAVMSHELRTPLNAIGGYAELLDMGLQGPITDTQRESLQRIRRSQRHLLALIDDVLTFARLESGKLEYRCEPVPLDALLAGLEPTLTSQLRGRGLRYGYARLDPAVTVWADRDKVSQIVTNLLTNAIKFTERGGVTLRCDVERDVVRVAVEDTGIGIAAEKLEAIFEPFVQAEAGLTRTTQGTGLGLAISRDLARGMRGDLTVASTLGSGSTFTLTLPRSAPVA